MNKQTDILFMNCPSCFTSYKGTKINVIVQTYPLLNIMCLAASAREKGFSVAVLDLGIEDNPYNVLYRKLEELRPRVVGITSTTSLFYEAADLSKRVKEKLGSDVKVIYGGPHATALPEESLINSAFDIAVCSEGEDALVEILEEKPLSEIKGIYYKNGGGQIFSTPSRELIKDLDSLPFPAFDLYDLTRYKCTPLISRKAPIGPIETSRGCPNRCTFCCQSISKRVFRKKSPERVIEEIKYILKLGVKEIRLWDDQFAVDIVRAKKICELILKENLNFSWNLAAGVRVDRVDEEFLVLAKRSGCYQIGIGFESGDQASLDSVEKGITLDESIKCMELMRKVGIEETVGLFMLGLPTDTEESLKKTIDLAVRLMPDYARTSIVVPFPGTKLFEEYDKKGLIKSRDWSWYTFHGCAEKEIYQHPILSHATLKKYYKLFYRKFYLNPRYISRRLKKGLRERTLVRDAYYGVRSFFPNLFSPTSDPFIKNSHTKSH